MKKKKTKKAKSHRKVVAFLGYGFSREPKKVQREFLAALRKLSRDLEG